MSFAEKAIDVVWKDGEFIPWEDATIHGLAHAAQYGSVPFEGIRCYETSDGPAIFRMDDHFDRFEQSMAVLGMDLDYSRRELREAVTGVLQRNELTSGYIRPWACYGLGAPGATSYSECPVHVFVAAWARGRKHGGDEAHEGIDVQLSPWRRTHSAQIPTTAKLGGTYLNGVIAHREARAAGFTDAVLLDMDGNVAEGPGANLFGVTGDTVFTPGLDSSILDGITRRTVITLARDLGYDVDVGTVTTGELLGADELFFTGTGAEITPIRQVSATVITEHAPGPVTDQIREEFFAVVRGAREQYYDWLAFV